jgi:hypothetical protein
MDLPYERRFHFRDGTTIGDLEELRRKIETISYQEFYHHVNTSKNDFASWVRNVLHDERLADELQKVTSIVETVEIINDQLHPHPAPPSGIDLQSSIEQTIFGSPLPPAMPEEQVVVEQVTPQPPQRPAIVTPVQKGPELDFRIIEEKAGISDPRAQARVQEELFGAVKQPEPPKLEQIERVEHENTRMIVKDFVYGLVFGLLIGVILGRIVS